MSMLRIAARGLRQANGLRGIATSAVARSETATSAESKKAFLEKFAPFQGTLAEPEFPSNFLPKEEEADPSAPIPEKLTLNFFVPNASIYSGAKVDLVLLPAVSGDFGAAPGHVPTIAQLRPGVVTVQADGEKDQDKYFVSGGFAFVHPGSVTDVLAVSAYKIGDFDPEAVRAGLADAQARLAAAQGKSELEAAQAQVGVEVYSALSSALGH